MGEFSALLWDWCCVVLIVLKVLQIFTYVIIGDAILSWVVRPDRFPRNITTKLTEPLYRPIHKVLDPAKTGGIDLAPIVVLVAIQLVSNVLARSAF